MTNELARLIAEVKETTGRSYGDIAERGRMPRSTVHKLATAELTTMPKLETLNRLAQGLDVPVGVVTRAAQAASGYSVYEAETPDATTELLISNISQLDPDQRAAVAALVQRLLRTTT